jgi:hypothetical protein
MVPQRGGDVGGAGEVQDAGQIQRLAVDYDQPPPACRRCGALPGSDPQQYPGTPVRRPPLSIVSTTLPTPASPHIAAPRSGWQRSFMIGSSSSRGTLWNDSAPI